MKDIKLISLELTNFKCHRHLRLDFDGRNTEIAGDNATGKTSVYDSLMWLLFSKDSQGNGDKNLEVKPLDSDGNVIDHDAITEVEAIFQVNGEKLALCRTYREKWETRRGSAEAVFTGNTSEYTIDGVPVKRNGFQDKVNELVDEDTFRLLTNTSYFAAGISWQERREILFKVAGVMEDGQILATNEQFTPLVESMGKLSLEDYKKKLLSEKRKFVGAKTEIPARISECQKTIEDIQGLDFTKAKAQVDALQATLNGISEQIIAIEHDNAADQKRLEIGNAQLELSQLENENKAYRNNQLVGSVNVHGLSVRITSLRRQMELKTGSVRNESAYITQIDEKITASRNEWISVNGETFTVGKCRTCGQDLPAEQVKAAKERFEADKKKRLDKILQDANTYKEYKSQAEDRLLMAADEITQIEAEIADLQAQIEAAEATRVEPKDMDDYAERKAAIMARMQTLSEELHDMMMASTDVIEKLRDEKKEIQAAISVQMAIVNKESLLDYSRQRVEELREDARNAAECLEAIEKMLFLMDEYSRYKTRFVEDSINGLFRIARFRLFREQANGGIEDRCDVVYDGVPYISVNNGMKINLGIDIINTLSMAYGVRVPLFVDNAESVTQLENSASQIIRLVVSENDKELRVNYEN